MLKFKWNRLFSNLWTGLNSKEKEYSLYLSDMIYLVLINVSPRVDKDLFVWALLKM